MNEIERDRQLDAAWSAASRDQPPPALDAEIRAAARHAVDAAPGRTRNKHWWYPLAAAATVAMLALGIAQLTPLEQLAPTMGTEVAVAPREAPADAARQTTDRDATLATAPAATPASPQYLPAQPAPGAGTGTSASARARVAPAKESKQAVEAKEAISPQDKLAAATPVMAAANTTPAARAAAPAPTPRSEPFPATLKAESRREASLEEHPPATSAPTGAVAEELQAQSRIAGAKVARADEASVKDASARDVEEWIKRIRALKNEGRLEEAAKELAAFRTAYGDHADGLLPADLRQIKR